MGHEELLHSGPPSERPTEPDHPMLLDGDVTAGDTEFMLRCMCEEYLRSGTAVEALWAMCCDPSLQGLHAAVVALGARRAREVLDDTARCVGVHRAAVWERPEVPCVSSAAGSGPGGGPACDGCNQAMGA